MDYYLDCYKVMRLYRNMYHLPKVAEVWSKNKPPFQLPYQLSRIIYSLSRSEEECKTLP